MPKTTEEIAAEAKAATGVHDPATLSAVEEKLAVMRDKIDEVDEVQPAPKEEEPQEEPQEETHEEEPQEEPQGESQDEDQKDLPMLPAGHRRAALARGFTTEEVDQYLRIKPEEAVQHFGEVFDDWQKDNSAFSRRGRQLIKTDDQPIEGGVAPTDTKAPEALPMLDAKVLAEEHGLDEAFVSAIVGPMNAQTTKLNAIAMEFVDSKKFIKDTESDTLATTIQTFFTSDEMKPLSETYGLDDVSLTQEQVDKRMELLNEADIISAGARDHGQDMPILDALGRAFSIVSQGSRDEILRQKIRKSMTKRTKTLPSSHQQVSTRDSNEPLSDKEFETVVRKKMNELNYGSDE